MYSMGSINGYLPCPPPLEDHLGTADTLSGEDRSLRGNEPWDSVSLLIMTLTLR